MSDTERTALEVYLEVRDEAIDIVKEVLAHHRPERDPQKRVVTCTKVYDEPHEVIKTQWPGWRDHVAPVIVDELFKKLLPSPVQEEP